jgi:diguanylate cyclase (GGDEF)-like protein/PAS domain S-box-containing protein
MNNWMEAAGREAALEAENARLNKIVGALMERAERLDKHGSSFDLFQNTVLLEEQVRTRTEELENALCENEAINADLQRTQERMRQEMEERRRVETRLRQAAIVFSSAQNGIVLTDAGGQVIAVNPAFTEITGYSEDDIQGENMSELHSGVQDAAFYRNMWQALLATGTWQGEIWNRRKNGETFFEALTINAVRDDNGLVTHYIGVFSDITYLEHASQLEQQAHQDALTGLPNRRLLLSRLDQALDRVRRSGEMGAVLFFDLDHFKNVNDSLGHAAGDELLRDVSARLQEHLRTVDTLARLGGDEFIVVLEDLTSPDDAARVALMLINHLGRPFWLADSREVYIGASVGISIFPADGDNSGQLIQRADTALYQAKARGRGAYRFYTAAMTQAAEAHVRLEANLRRALLHDEFVLHYQPLVRVNRPRVTGVEALVRWQSPELGEVPPAQFIPLAEDCGLILALGDWVLREACAQMKRWLDIGLPLDTMAVNLSPRQFSRPGLITRLRKILDETGLPARYLELEITEGAIMDYGPDSIACLSELKGLGVRLAIDDFGTGYSSLAYLRRLPIDKLKVDRSFVGDIPDNADGMQIAAAVIALARNLRLEVLAEGVETETQLSFMDTHHCDTCQGFLFSPPLPENDFVTWLSKRHDMPG